MNSKNFIPLSPEYVDQMNDRISNIENIKTVEEKRMAASIDLTVLIAYVFGKTSFLHKEIDELYQTNSIQYYKYAKNSKWYNSSSCKQFTLFEQIAYKKTIGILEYVNDMIEKNTEEEKVEKILSTVYNLLKKGYRKIYLLFKDKKQIDLLEVMHYIDITYTSARDNAYNVCRYFVAYIFGIQLSLEYGEESVKDIDKVTGVIYAVINNEIVMIDKPKLDTRATIKPNIKKLFDNNFFVCIQGLYLVGEESDVNYEKHNEPELSTFTKYAPEIKDKFYYQLRVLDRIFAMEEMDKTSLLGNYEYSKKEIEEMLSLIEMFGHIEDDKDYVPLLVSAVYIRTLIKAYKETREAYLINSKELLFQELEILKEKNKGLRQELANEKDKNTILSSKVEEYKNNNPYEQELMELKRENEKLKQQLEQAKQDKEELKGLREFAFSLEQQEEVNVEKVDLNEIKEKLHEIKGVIVGGHTNWQKKMKEVLEWTYIPANVKINKSMLADYEVFVINFAHFNHSSYTPLIDYIRSSGKQVIYINDTNIEKSLNTIYKNIE